MTAMTHRPSTFALSLSTGIIICALLLSSPSSAQDAPEPKRYENVDWHEVVLVDFHPGKTERATEIVSTYFEPATKESGTVRPHAIELKTGPWDMMLIWNMKEGPTEMTWETHPGSIKWWKAFVNVVGGEEKAEEVMSEYEGLVARTTSFVGFSGRHGLRLAAGN